MLSPKIYITLALSLASVASISAHAEQVSMPNKAQYVLDNAPNRGVGQDEVIKHYGEPASKQKGVGMPVISSWTYPNFKVFFENGKVIHTVGM